MTSTSTQAVNCAQASQTTTVRMDRNVWTVISRWSQSSPGAPSGNGHPIWVASASGTPATSTSSTTKARNALTKSPNVRRRTRTGCGVRFRGAEGAGGAVELEELVERRRGMAGVLCRVREESTA